MTQLAESVQFIVNIEINRKIDGKYSVEQEKLSWTLTCWSKNTHNLDHENHSEIKKKIVT